MIAKTVKANLRKLASAKIKPKLRRTETGEVAEIISSIVLLTGLKSVGLGELVDIKGTPAIVLKLTEDKVGAVLLGDPSKIKAGDRATRTFQIASVPVGEALLGRVLDPLGSPLDGGKAIKTAKRLPIERPAPPIIARSPVDTPLQTGIKSLDSMIPIGKGQRELILGDRQTGKTALALNAIIAQKDTGVICIYCAIGGQTDSTARLIESIKEHGNFANTIIVSASGDSSPASLYIAPYSATSMAEYFAEQGKSVLIVYDSLSSHAMAYRQLSLLLKRPPGREAYPSDIFYLHSRLLERSAKLKNGGSITALPICETQAENLSSYIPTNLISITDGQIFLSNSLFQKGIIPAVNIGVSVSRIGGKAQLPAYKDAAALMKISYSQFEELEAFSKFSATLDDETKAKLTRGLRTRELLKQPQLHPIPAAEQVVLITALNEGVFDAVPLPKMKKAEDSVIASTAKQSKATLTKITKGQTLTPADIKEVVKIARNAI